MSDVETAMIIVVLLAAGLVFLLLEILTPMFGLLVGLGLTSFGGAVWLCFAVNSWLGIGVLLALVFAVPAYMTLLVKLLPKSPLGRRLFLGKAPEAGGDAAPEADEHRSMVGREGTAETPLRPSGAVRVDGRRVIASAETGMIEQGARVRVLRAVGNSLVVREINTQE